MKGGIVHSKNISIKVLVLCLIIYSLLVAQDQIIRNYIPVSGLGVKTVFHDAIPSDGGYVIVGITADNNSNWDTFIAKFDSASNCLWARRIDINPWDICWSIIQTGDHGYAIGGYTGPIMGPVDYLLLKFDNAGNLQFAKTFGGTGNDVGFSVIRTLDAGFLMAGHTNGFGAAGYDMLIIKIDSTGNYQWARTIDFSGTGDFFKKLITTNDSGYAVTGTVTNVYTLVAHLDSLCNPLWAKIIYPPSSQMLQAQGLIQVVDGGIMTTAALCDSPSGLLNDIVNMKLNNQGNLEWARQISLRVNNCNIQILPTDLIQKDADTYVGIADLFYDDTIFTYSAPCIYKFGLQGNLIWLNTAGHPEVMGGSRLFLVNNDDYLFWGNTEDALGDVFPTSLKFDSSGNTCKDDTFTLTVIDSAIVLTAGQLSPTVNYINPTIEDVSPSVVIGTLSDSIVCEYFTAIQEVSKETIDDNFEVMTTTLFFDRQIELSFSKTTSLPISLVLYDIIGRPVYANSCQFTPFRLLITGEKIMRLPDGVYFLVINARHGNICIKKLIKLHK